VFQFCSALRFGAVLLALYFAAVSGSYLLGMSVFSITSVVQIVADVPLGVLSDRFGRKPVIVAGAVAALAFTTCYAIGLNYGFLALAAALEGLSRALFSGTDTALLYETLAEEGEQARFATYLGRISAVEPLAFTGAALAGGFIAAVWSFHLAFWLSLVPLGAALGAALLLHEPAAALHQARPRVSLREALRAYRANERLRLIVAAAAWREACGESAFQFRVTFFRQLWPLWALGFAQALTNAVAMVSFYAGGPAMARLGAVRLLIADSLFGRLLSLPALLFPTPLSPALMSLTSLSYGTTQVASGALAQHEFTDAERATMGSLSSLAVNLGFAAGAPLVGLLADRAGIVPALVLSQLLLLLTLPLYRRLDGILRHA
jgi:MFS family permease